MKYTCCATCAHADFPTVTAHKPPRPKPFHAGRCLWAFPADPNEGLPLNLWLTSVRSAIFPETTGCLCWVAKGGAK